MTALCYIGIMAAVFLGELWLKNRVEKNGVEGKTTPRLKGLILIRKHHNKGAALNIGQGRRRIVAGLSLLLTAGVLVLFVLSLGQKGNLPLRAGLSLLLGGAFSNTYDRLKRRYVVDYFSFGVKWQPLRNIIFNLSDLCIIIGSLTAALSVGQKG